MQWCLPVSAESLKQQLSIACVFTAELTPITYTQVN